MPTDTYIENREPNFFDFLLPSVEEEAANLIIEKALAPDPLEGSILTKQPTISPAEDLPLEKPEFGLMDLLPAGDALYTAEKLREAQYLSALSGILSLLLPGTLRVKGAKVADLGPAAPTIQGAKRAIEPASDSDAVKVLIGDLKSQTKSKRGY